MTTTHRLRLPVLLQQQAQKHVTMNEALHMLDALVQSVAESAGSGTPPSDPGQGDAYIVAGPADGDWTGEEGRLAVFHDGAWALLVPTAGWRVWVKDVAALYIFDGADWLVFGEQQTQLGISTTADDTDRLAVSSPASLFTHAGTGHQLKINKASAGDTASVLFQTGYSGRAEIGLAGLEQLEVKVSENGADWLTAIAIAPETGRIGCGTSAPEALLHIKSDLPRLRLEDAQGGSDADRSWDLTSSYDTVTGDCAFTIASAGAGFGSGGVALDVRKDSSGIGRLGYFGLSEDDAIIATNANLTQSGSDGFRFEFNNVGNSGRSVFRAAFVDSSDPSKRTSSAQLAFAADNNGDQTATISMGGYGRFSDAVEVGGYTVSTLPDANRAAGQVIYVSDAPGGPTLAYSDGADWRGLSGEVL